MIDCPPDYCEAGSFRAGSRIVRFEIRADGGLFRARVWTGDDAQDKVASSPDYHALWSAVRELAWSWLVQ